MAFRDQACASVGSLPEIGECPISTQRGQPEGVLAEAPIVSVAMELLGAIPRRNVLIDWVDAGRCYKL